MNRFSSNESYERSSNHKLDIDALCVCLIFVMWTMRLGWKREEEKIGVLVQ